MYSRIRVGHEKEANIPQSTLNLNNIAHSTPNQKAYQCQSSVIIYKKNEESAI